MKTQSINIFAEISDSSSGLNTPKENKNKEFATFHSEDANAPVSIQICQNERKREQIVKNQFKYKEPTKKYFEESPSLIEECSMEDEETKTHSRFLEHQLSNKRTSQVSRQSSNCQGFLSSIQKPQVKSASNHKQHTWQKEKKLSKGSLLSGSKRDLYQRLRGHKKSQDKWSESAATLHSSQTETPQPISPQPGLS